MFWCKSVTPQKQPHTHKSTTTTQQQQTKKHATGSAQIHICTFLSSQEWPLLLQIDQILSRQKNLSDKWVSHWTGGPEKEVPGSKPHKTTAAAASEIILTLQSLSGPFWWWRCVHEIWGTRQGCLCPWILSLGISSPLAQPRLASLGCHVARSCNKEHFSHRLPTKLIPRRQVSSVLHTRTLEIDHSGEKETTLRHTLKRPPLSNHNWNLSLHIQRKWTTSSTTSDR